MHTPVTWTGAVRSGAGGASAAFLHANGRRMDEIEAAIAVRPYPGSLNVHLSSPFDWTAPHIRAQVLDVVRRGQGLFVEWAPRTARLYPVTVDGVEAWVFRFVGERYDAAFVELVAPVRLRDHVDNVVTLCLR